MPCNQELTLVVENVRSDYLAMLAARDVIDKAAAASAASLEELRIAHVRLKSGIATNLDVIAAATRLHNQRHCSG
jgi:outer membrane protein TolC